MKREELETLFHDTINPTLLKDNGWAEIEDYDAENGILTVRLRGACSSCMAASDTVDGFMTEAVQKAFPEVRQVEMTDRADPELEDIAKKILNHTIQF